MAMKPVEGSRRQEKVTETYGTCRMIIRPGYTFVVGFKPVAREASAVRFTIIFPTE
jgi:hypothetical protein